MRQRAISNVTLAYLSFVSAFLCPLDAHSQEGFPAWVGLFDPETLGWLENENRIQDLCAEPSALAQCYAEMLEPKLSVYPLRTAPNHSSLRFGELIIAAVPGRGLSAHFYAAQSNQPISFTPDLFLQDWGYGPYFHGTILSRRGDWFELPMYPWDETVWLFRDSESDKPTVISIQTGDVIELHGTSHYVVAAESDALLVRGEQPGDHWCESGEPPPIEPEEPSRISRAELSDSRGHLLFQIKYLKEC